MSASDQQPGAAPEHHELPLPDYDHLSVDSLSHRVRTLDADGVRQLLAYERQHGDRLPVTTVLEQRLEALLAGAEPTGGSPEAAEPEAPAPPDGGSQVPPETHGPATNPPAQGDPTNPKRTRRTH